MPKIPIIHKMSFYIGYEAAWEQALQMGLPETSSLTADHAYEIRSAQLADSHARVYVFEDKIIIEDTYKNKWAIQMTGHPHDPIVLSLLERG